jgi:hypothetical protein
MFAVPAGKGKLEKMSLRTSSICNGIGAQGDILTEIFDLRL